jgi:hypothetical protein
MEQLKRLLETANTNNEYELLILETFAAFRFKEVFGVYNKFIPITNQDKVKKIFMLNIILNALKKLVSNVEVAIQSIKQTETDPKVLELLNFATALNPPGRSEELLKTFSINIKE